MTLNCDHRSLQRSAPGKVIASNIKVQVVSVDPIKKTVTLFDGETEKTGKVQGTKHGK